MKKVIRLTESDLTRIVKRVIKEDSSLRNIVKDKISSSMTTSGKFIESEQEIKNDILTMYDEKSKATSISNKVSEDEYQGYFLSNKNIKCIVSRKSI